MTNGAGNRLLIVDDDEQLVSMLSIKLTALGYQVDGALTAADGLRQALKDNYDVIILDILMPKRSGLEICEDLRAKGVLTPVLILSGKTEKNSIVKGLELGADDYLTKPFSNTELAARLKALTRRNKKSFSSQLLNRHGVELDVLAHVARFGEEFILLTEKETLLLKRLMSEAPRSVPRAVLLQDVWGVRDTYASNRLEVYIRRLRTKLEALSGNSHIRTIRGAGYYFNDA